MKNLSILALIITCTITKNGFSGKQITTNQEPKQLILGKGLGNYKHDLGPKKFYHWLLRPISYITTKIFFSKDLVGRFANSKFSTRFIPLFKQKYKIDNQDFIPPRKQKTYKNLNDYFTRELKTPELRPFDKNSNTLISPSDSFFSASQNINSTNNFIIKSSKFNLEDFLGGKKHLAKKFENGTMLTFRLAPKHYHHIHAPCDLKIKKVYNLDGVLESVAPIAYIKKKNPLTRNQRKIIIAQSPEFGEFIIVPVGALFVGKIKMKIKKFHEYKKGQDLGYFEFGGSTVVLLFKQNCLKTVFSFLKNSEKNIETEVLMGQLVGHK